MVYVYADFAVQWAQNLDGVPFPGARLPIASGLEGRVHSQRYFLPRGGGSGGEGGREGEGGKKKVPPPPRSASTPASAPPAGAGRGRPT